MTDRQGFPLMFEVVFDVRDLPAARARAEAVAISTASNEPDRAPVSIEAHQGALGVWKSLDGTISGIDFDL